MTTLSSGNLFATLDSLPGEAVLWQGPPDRNATRILLLQAMAFLAIASLLIAAFVCTAFYLDRLDEKPSSQPVGSVSPASPSPAHVPSQRAHSRGANPAHLIWVFPLMFLFAFGMVGGFLSAILFVTTLVSLVRVPHAWYLLTTERVCIQTGWLTKSLVTVDLDKVISLKASGSWLQRRYHLHSIEVIHAGSRGLGPHAGWPYSALSSSPYTIGFVGLEIGLLGLLSKAWLPRDNRRGAEEGPGSTHT